MERARVLSNGLIEPAFDRVVVAQRLDPRRNKKIKLAEWELVENGLEDLSHRRIVERQAVYRQARHAIA